MSHNFQYENHDSQPDRVSANSFENTDNFEAYRSGQLLRAGVQRVELARVGGNWYPPAQLDLSTNIYDLRSQRETGVAAVPHRHAYETSALNDRVPPLAPAREHVYTGSFIAGDTTCDISLPKSTVEAMPSGATVIQIQEIPDHIGLRSGYHTVQFNLSKQEGYVDFNVLGLSRQHANNCSINFDQASQSVHLQERLEPAHAAISQTRVNRGTATKNDYDELRRRQYVPVHPSYPGFYSNFIRR